LLFLGYYDIVTIGLFVLGSAEIISPPPTFVLAFPPPAFVPLLLSLLPINTVLRAVKNAVYKNIYIYMEMKAIEAASRCKACTAKDAGSKNTFTTTEYSRDSMVFTG